MKKLKFLSIILSSFLGIMFASPANALSTGHLYEYCKPLADRGFKFVDSNDIQCLIYFDAVLGFARKICFETKTTNLDITRLAFGIEPGMSKNLNAAIQSFINDVAKAPEDWEYEAASNVIDALKNTHAECQK